MERPFSAAFIAEDWERQRGINENGKESNSLEHDEFESFRER
jgi:hypothetical protein